MALSAEFTATGLAGLFVTRATSPTFDLMPIVIALIAQCLLVGVICLVMIWRALRDDDRSPDFDARHVDARE